MLIKLEGKQDLQGKSKTSGKDYHFYVLHFLVKNPRVDGLSAVQVQCDPSVISYSLLRCGQEYNVDFDMSGHLVSISSK